MTCAKRFNTIGLVLRAALPHYTSVVATAAASDSRSIIVLILVDGHGCYDLGCFDAIEVKTPRVMLRQVSRGPLWQRRT